PLLGLQAVERGGVAVHAGSRPRLLPHPDECFYLLDAIQVGLEFSLLDSQVEAAILLDLVNDRFGVGVLDVDRLDDQLAKHLLRHEHANGRAANLLRSRPDILLILLPDRLEVFQLVLDRPHALGGAAQVQAGAGHLVHLLEAILVSLESGVAVSLRVTEVQLGLQPAARPQVDRLLVLPADLEALPVPFVGRPGHIEAGGGPPPRPVPPPPPPPPPPPLPPALPLPPPAPPRGRP